MPTKSTPLKSSKSSISSSLQGKTTLSRPQSPAGSLIGTQSHSHSKGAMSLCNSAANTPKASS